MGGRHYHWRHRPVRSGRDGGTNQGGAKNGRKHRVVKRAKVLDPEQFKRLQDFVEGGLHPLRDRVMILLSYKGGLRSQEIAGLDWRAVCNADGKLRMDYFEVGAHIQKNGNGRTIPMHPDLYFALEELREARPKDKAIIYGVRRPRMSPNSVTVYLFELYRKLNFEGCSSHSGRRTFITALARKANLHDCSLKDVQLVAGHKHLETTECYLEPSSNIGRLVSAI
jgi:integrase/recombinase XerD